MNNQELRKDDEPSAIKISAYEVGGMEFSQIIISASIIGAIVEFVQQNPNQAVIFAQNNDIVNAHPEYAEYISPWLSRFL